MQYLKQFPPCLSDSMFKFTQFKFGVERHKPRSFRASNTFTVIIFLKHMKTNIFRDKLIKPFRILLSERRRKVLEGGREGKEGGRAGGRADGQADRGREAGS